MYANVILHCVKEAKLMFLLQRIFGQVSFGFVFIFLSNLISLKTCIQSKLIPLLLCCFIQV